ncbi:hypothetical protein HFN_1051 [Helicobacter fennelliae MRY12-0050]|uniref:Uncharacterized protein n=1 Tax=Helicobacter fennelliae MRY12-0050 TaxID=1325130 RepID=T1D3J7_9HELI|nr:hypothetical protein HFN_1051 [Helicobacter fennelliae MRY12-0050]
MATHAQVRLTWFCLAPNSQNHKNKLKIENFLHAPCVSIESIFIVIARLPLGSRGNPLLKKKNIKNYKANQVRFYT